MKRSALQRTGRWWISCREIKLIRDLKADPHWDRLRSEPRFELLLRKMAYPTTL